MNLETRTGTERNQLFVNREHAMVRLNAALQTPQERAFLREHQTSMVKALHDFLGGGRTSGYMNEPWGAGKSLVMASLADIIGVKTVILSPTQLILEGTYKEAKKFTPQLSIGNFYSSEKDLSKQVVNTTYQSMLRLLENGEGEFNPEDVGLLFLDESDLSLGEKRHSIFRRFPNALKIGMTATPYFDPLFGLMQRGLVDEKEEWTGLYTNRIHEMSLEEAIEREIAVPIDFHLVKTHLVVPKIQVMSNGEYSPSDLRRYLDQRARNALAVAMIAGVDHLPRGINISNEQRDQVNEIHQKIRGKRTVIFAIDIDHAEQLKEEVINAGVVAETVHSHVPRGKINNLILPSHETGKIPVLIGVDILGRGWNSPETEVGMFLRPTPSGILAGQQLGRVIRPSHPTGKTTATAVQMVDQFARIGNTPVLLPDILNPEYVLRGTQSGAKPTERKVTDPRGKVIFSFSGININSIFENARSRDIIQKRLTQGSIEETAKLFDSLVDEVQKDSDLLLGIYELFQKICYKLPERILIEAQNKALQAVASIDTNTRRLGEKAFLLLTMKTLITVVDAYFVDGIDNETDKEEMILGAINGVVSKLKEGLRPNAQISQQINYAARDGVAEYLSIKDGIRPNWIRTPADRRLILGKIKNALGELKELNKDQVENLAREINEETQIPLEEVRDYLNINFAQYPSDTNGRQNHIGENVVFEEAQKQILKKDMLKVLSTLNARERIILELRFGLLGKIERTLREIGYTLGLNAETIRQLETKALRKLRHPSRKKFIESYLYPDGQEAAEEFRLRREEEKRTMEKSRKYTIDRIDFGKEEVNQQLKAIGIRQIGDFFSASPQEISEGWPGEKSHLINAVQIVLGILKDPSFQDMGYITEAVIYRGNMDDVLKTLEVEEASAIGMLGEFRRATNLSNETLLNLWKHSGISSKKWIIQTEELRNNAHKKIFDYAVTELKGFFQL